MYVDLSQFFEPLTTEAENEGHDCLYATVQGTFHDMLASCLKLPMCLANTTEHCSFSLTVAKSWCCMNRLTFRLAGGKISV